MFLGRVVESQPDTSWFQKETRAYYVVFWISLAIGLALIVCPLLAYVTGIFLLFQSGVLTIWGSALICPGLRQKESVLNLTVATAASALPLLLAVYLILG